MIKIVTLRELRKKSPYKLEQIAKHMGVSPRTIQLWESGRVPITAVNLQRLLALYQVDNVLLSDIHKLIPQEGRDNT